MFLTFSKRKFRGRNHLKTTWLVTPKSNWPPPGKSGTYICTLVTFLFKSHKNNNTFIVGSTMKYLESKNGIMYFSFEHSPEYQQVQMQLYTAVSHMSSGNLVVGFN